MPEGSQGKAIGLMSCELRLQEMFEYTRQQFMSLWSESLGSPTPHTTGFSAVTCHLKYTHLCNRKLCKRQLWFEIGELRLSGL